MATTERVAAPTRLPLRPQDEAECRRCEVHCDKVVYPSACVDRACPFLYAYEARGTRTSAACRRSSRVEIDLELLREAEARREGFGAIKAMRQPLPMCRTGVERCYEHRSDELGCVNPEFFELPEGRPTFRVFARLAG